MKILIVIPVYYRDELAYNSVRSILGLTQVPHGVKVKVVVVINKVEHPKTIDTLRGCVGFDIDYEVVEFPENLGKAKAVNTIASSESFDFLISIDGDMLCVSRSWLVDMIELYITYNRNPIYANIDGIRTPVKLGALCSNQTGNGCHILTRTSPGAIVNKHRSTLITKIGYGVVAGGVLMTDSGTWKSIGGYDGTKIYGGDDGYYSYMCHNKHLLMGYIEEVSFFHPYDMSPEYVEWKRNVISDQLKGNPTPKVGFFE